MWSLLPRSLLLSLSLSRSRLLHLLFLLVILKSHCAVLQRPSYASVFQQSNSNTAQASNSAAHKDQEKQMRLMYVERQTLLNTTILCNDGSSAGYYIRRSESSNNWLIFLEGGLFCYDQQTCSERKASTTLCSSRRWPPNREAKHIMSGDSIANPLYANETVVLVPYCSSDLWSGNSLRRSNVSDFYFMGSLIVKELVKQLLSTENLALANRVLLAGSSAGGIGALLNFQNVKALIENYARRNRIHPAPQVRTFVDSAWFLDISEQDMSKMDRVLPSESASESYKGKKTSSSKATANANANANDSRPRFGFSALKSRITRTTTTAPATTTSSPKRKRPCTRVGCPPALKETIKIASAIWQPDLPHGCTRLISNVHRPWRCFYPFVLLRSMQKSRNPIPVFILQSTLDSAQTSLDFVFGQQRPRPAYLEAVRDKMRTTLLKTTPLFVGVFTLACYTHEVLVTHAGLDHWSKLEINNTSIADAVRCWERKLDVHHHRALSRLAQRTNNNLAVGNGYWAVLRPTNARVAYATENVAPKCKSRLFELESYPLSNAGCADATSPFTHRSIDRIGILREFGYSNGQINRLLNLTDRRKILFPSSIPLP